VIPTARRRQISRYLLFSPENSSTKNTGVLGVFG
jgi:hypothetical protein